MAKEQLARVERVRQERRTPVTLQRPLAKVICKSGPAVSRMAEPVDSYVRHNDGFGHNPNLK